MADEGKGPPGGCDEVPDGVSTGHDGASGSVESLDQVDGEGTSQHLESDVDGTGGNRDGFSNEELETGIGVRDGLADALGNDFRTTLDIHSFLD